MSNLKLYLEGIEARLNEYMTGKKTDEDGEAGVSAFLSEAVTEVYHILHEGRIYKADLCGADLVLYGDNTALPYVLLSIREFSGDVTAVLRAEERTADGLHVEELQLSDDAAAALYGEFLHRSEYCSYTFCC